MLELQCQKLRRLLLCGRGLFKFPEFGEKLIFDFLPRWEKAESLFAIVLGIDPITIDSDPRTAYHADWDTHELLFVALVNLQLQRR